MSEALGSPSVTRWRRYGKDRLYVTAADGSKVGWWDLTVGEGHPEAEHLAAALASAVKAWQQDPRFGARGETHPAETTEARPQPAEPEPVPAEFASSGATPGPPTTPMAAAPPAWEDLSMNRAGAMAREQAQALKDAAPVRTFLARALGVHTEERAWRIGADGEERVATQFEKVARKEPRWRFLHAVPVGERGSDIDHVAIGPGGVFTINAKHHPGAKLWIAGDTFLVDGQRQPYTRNSRHEANRAAKYLAAACRFPVQVTGVVVPVRAADITVKTVPEDVFVVPRMQIARWLLKRPQILDENLIELVFDTARRSTTWQR